MNSFAVQKNVLIADQNATPSNIVEDLKVKNVINENIYPIVRYKQKNEVQCRFDGVKGRIMCLAGAPGAGKSKLGSSLAHHLEADGVRAFYFTERVNAAHLNLYLQNKTGEAYAFQDCMVTRRLTTYIEAVHYAETGGFAIVDGPVITDNAFELLNYEAGFIDETHHALYCEMIKDFGELPAPDYVVYLDCQPETCIRRLRQRGNYAEILTYDLNYYQTIRRMNVIVAGKMKIATIPFDSDYPKNKEGFLERESVYSVLDDIISRAYENEGIVTTPVKKSEEVIVAYKAVEPLYLKRVGNVYIPVKK